MKTLNEKNTINAKEISAEELNNVSGGWGFDLDCIDLHIHSVTDIVKNTIGGAPGGYLITNPVRQIEGLITGRDMGDVAKENLIDIAEDAVNCAAAGMGAAVGKPVLLFGAALVKAKGQTFLKWLKNKF